MRLYSYDHCPFCVKARMIFGLKDIPVDVVTLLNDDVATPTRMIGAKMVPILEQDGQYMGESMDIVDHVDAMGGARVLTGAINPQVGEWIQATNAIAFRLILPRDAAAPLEEFATTAARAYFIRGKEKMVGPFGALLDDSAGMIAQVDARLRALVPLVRAPHAVNGELSSDDIHLFALLRSLTIVAGLSWPAEVAQYCRTMSQACGVPLFDTISA
ncbi:glutaredoxin 2 [Novacetimonas hansenii]|uniref:Glutaredoxin 2 n=2 Tax=Novacetimonas hansenii TaxID=436 RepID=A0AAW5EMQ0_NOVHA|nr:glutaredoxin 2 [Novacetimonas hansenii]MCJ8353043.1 glutaredoxin 2 [Novacetimonas hansenii]PYD72939.1 glutaredoxin 2 [Novacetimonas hansenii]RFP03784.1 glutaredoxin, GrxB family [Novacetimonas hansenii]WEQ58388.1 glutaredoxin 2 [Novacetimonas hansenii]CUW48465.1 Glutaredoxin-2 [Novacetimonas hansenii]